MLIVFGLIALVAFLIYVAHFIWTVMPSHRNRVDSPFVHIAWIAAMIVGANAIANPERTWVSWLFAGLWFFVSYFEFRKWQTYLQQKDAEKTDSVEE